MKNIIEANKNINCTEKALFIFLVFFSSLLAYIMKGVCDEAMNMAVKRKTIIMLKE